MVFKVAIAGLGVVGGGTAKLLTEHKDLLEKRCNRAMELTAVADVNEDRFRALNLPVSVSYYKDALEMVEKADADLVVELIGGADGIALTLCKKALESGKHYVTANKAMLARHGNELGALAERKGVFFGYEASVGGGIPVIKVLREGFVGNDISAVYGILNGTCNYILTKMRETKRPFADVLAEAQELGYAEKPDPSLDVDGVDTAHKTAILGALAFGMPVDFQKMHVEGIRHISDLDIAYADELGYRIKLLGIAKNINGAVCINVYPCMVPQTAALATVDGVFNAVTTEGDFVGRSVLIGRGAGEKPTASAVVSDIVDCATGRGLPFLTVPFDKAEKRCQIPLSERIGGYYLRFDVRDEAGVVADIARALGDEGVSIERMIQRSVDGRDTVPLIMTVHEAKEAAVTKALTVIRSLKAVAGEPCMIRIEKL